MANDVHTLKERAFFEQLRRETEAAFAKSRIGQRDDHAHYALCATPLHREAGVVCGIHWKAPDEPLGPQTEVPASTDLDERLVAVLDPMLQRFLDTSLNEVNYTSLCFFRTVSPDDLHDDDWQASVPLFVKYTLYLDPPWVLFLGTDLIERLVGFGLVDDYHTHVVREEGKRYESYSGELRTGPAFACVPNPQSLLPPDVHLALWREACAALT